jgi:hypothetical protein
MLLPAFSRLTRAATSSQNLTRLSEFRAEGLDRQDTTKVTGF